MLPVSASAHILHSAVLDAEMLQGLHQYSVAKDPTYLKGLTRTLRDKHCLETKSIQLT